MAGQYLDLLTLVYLQFDGVKTIYQLCLKFQVMGPHDLIHNPTC